MGKRQYDVLVYGATGFTGRQAARYLDEHAPAGLRLAIAGRSVTKLAELAGSLRRKEVGVVVADSASPDSVHAMCATTRVVCTTAGPFALYGTPVIEGCVQHQTHYCDITGETPWVHDMIARFQTAARSDGTRLIPFAGYDSCPSDLGAWLIAMHLRTLGEDTLRVDGFHAGKGGLNGGTLATMMAMGEQGRLRDAEQIFLLNPDGEPSAKTALDSVDQRRVFFHPRAQRYAAPFFMGAINSRVVRRSAALLAAEGAGYGPDFVYQEYFGTRGWLAAQLVNLGVHASGAMSGNRGARALLTKLGPKVGEGPSEAAMDNGWMKSQFYGVGSAGTAVDAEVSGPGDPGNRVTVRFLCETALALASDEERLPKRAGFLTPATGLGAILVDRMRARGMRLAIH